MANVRVRSYCFSSDELFGITHRVQQRRTNQKNEVQTVQVVQSLRSVQIIELTELVPTVPGNLFQWFQTLQTFQALNYRLTRSALVAVTTPVVMFANVLV
jgi:hypothetical protein